MCKENRVIIKIVEMLKEMLSGVNLTNDQWQRNRDDALRVIRGECNNCPACILSVLRQSRIPLYCFEFRFKDECESWWEEKNEQDRRDEYHAMVYSE